jgi:tetratricopeptide (TPR) repeat protein
LCLAIIVVTGVFLWMRHRRLLMWYAVFFVALIPVLHIVPLPTLMNDRYLYFPMLGAAALAGLGLERGLASKTVRWRLAAVCVAAGISIALSYASFERIAVWRDDVTLWRDVTEKTPKSTQAWLGLGISLFDAGRSAEAIQAYRQAIAEDPFYAMALNNLGATYNTMGQSSIGRPFLLRAVQVDPEYFDAYMNLGIGFRMSGDLAGAERAFSAALSIRPQSPEARDALRDLKGAVR